MKHRAQVSSFLKEEWITEADSSNERAHIKVDRIFQLYQQWCEENDVVAFYEASNAFARELFARRPQWRERKKRIHDEGQKIAVLMGLWETRAEPEVTYITKQ